MSDRSPSQSAHSNTSETILTDRAKRRKASFRRSHFKTRTGCKTCKKRKIKCDEQRPSCINCLKRGSECEFLAETSVYPNFFKIDETAPALNILDLQLMHHFITSTYATLFCHPPSRHFWRGEAIQMGFKCDYVMRAILAISALHLAHHLPERRELYTSTALTYHRMASRQAMSLMSDVKEENSSNLFVFSVLTIFFAMGGPSQPSEGMLLFGESSFPEWLFLIQGTKSLLEMLGPAGNRGQLDPFLSQLRWSQRWTRSHLEPENRSAMTDALDELEMQVSASVDDIEALRVYRYAIKELRTVSASFFDASQVDITDLFTWIYLVLDDFLPLLKVPTQVSVAIFCHFCVLIHKLEIHWWIQGWGDRLIRRAYKILDNRHKPWITWPVEEMGCVLST